MSQSENSFFGFYSSTAVVVIVGAVHYFLSQSAIEFEAVFKGFGTELPFVTQLMLPGSIYFWAMPGIALATVVLHQLKVVDKDTVVILSTLMTFASIGLFIIGMYLPIIQLGGAVSNTP